MASQTWTLETHWSDDFLVIQSPGQSMRRPMIIGFFLFAHRTRQQISRRSFESEGKTRIEQNRQTKQKQDHSMAASSFCFLSLLFGVIIKWTRMANLNQFSQIWLAKALWLIEERPPNRSPPKTNRLTSRPRTLEVKIIIINSNCSDDDYERSSSHLIA